MSNIKFNLFRLILLVVIVVLSNFFVIPQVLAANDGDLVQVGNGPIYLIEGNFKRQLKDPATFLSHLCWSGIRKISQAELNLHPTGPEFTRVIQYGPDVYLIQNCQKRHVLSIDALSWNGFSTRDIKPVNTSTFDHWSQGSDLTAPKLMKASASGTEYFVDAGVKRPVKDEDTFVEWRFSHSDVVINKSVNQYPTGSALTRVVLFSNNVYAVDSGTFRYAGDENHLRLNGYDPKDLVAIGNDAANYLSIGANLSIPRAIEDKSTGIKYLVDENELRQMYSNFAYSQWGLTDGDITKVSRLIGISPVSTLNLLIRDAGGGYWYAWRGVKRHIPDAETFNDYGLSNADASPATWAFIRYVREGDPLSRGVDSLSGVRIPATRGKTAREQHLYLNSTEANLGRTDAGANSHYSRSGTPLAAQNGLAGGYGAFGSEASPASTDQERYYINMRWGYAEWYEDCEAKDGNHCTTRTRNLDIGSKNWHRHKKVIVKNPANNRHLVVSVEESGPAIWTDRVSGLSPEAMLELGASTDDTLEYGWAVNQDLRLGLLY